MKLKQKALITALVFIILVIAASAAYFFINKEKIDGILWTGKGSESKCSAMGSGADDWSCPSNWRGRVVPGEDDIVVFMKGSAAERAIIDERFEGKIKSLIIDGYEGEIIQETDLEIVEQLDQSSGVYSVLDENTTLTVEKLSLKEEGEFYLGTKNATVGELEIEDIRKFHEEEGSKIGIEDEDSWESYVVDKVELETYKPREIVDEEGLGTGKYVLTNLNSNLLAYVSVKGFELQSKVKGVGGLVDWFMIFDLKSLKQGPQEVIFENISDDTIDRVDDIIEVQRGGGLVEWYENKFEEITQGFTISKKLNIDGNLQIAATINTNLDILEKDEGKIIFSYEEQSVLDYKNLKAFDNNNSSLPIWFEYISWENSKLEFMIVIDDTNAEYPVTIK